MMSASVTGQRRNQPSKVRADALAQEYAERRHRQSVALAQLDCIADAPSQDLLRLAHLCTLRVFLPDAHILTERMPAEFLYLVLRGTVSLTLHDRAGHKVLIGVLNRGDCFGEGPLFGDLFHGATATAETICYLLQLPLDDVRKVLEDIPGFASALRSIYRRRLVESTLGRVPLFSQISPLERARIAGLLQSHEYARGTAIIREGEPGDALYLIEAGQVVVEQAGQVIAYLSEGDFFGEMSLLTAQPHNADIYAHTPVEVASLPAADFNRLLDRQPDLATQLHEVVERRRAARVALQHDRKRLTQVNTVVERGMLRGSHLFVRDPDLCVEGCRICEDACAARHGRARLSVAGVTINGMIVADACRQCRVGAECVEACPSDAIQWDEHGALTITDSCTGCGACVPACPYEAVQLVARAPDRAAPLWTRIKRLATPVIPLVAAAPELRADKCDLCHGYDDMACVSACPTGALRLVPIEEVFPF